MDKSPVKMLFMGSDIIALSALNFLVNWDPSRLKLVGVFTQPDRPSGRGKKLTPNGIKEWAIAREIPVYQPEKIGEADAEVVRDLGVELVLVMAYGHILRQSFLDLPRLGTYNLHASLLPKYRGASPIQAALAAGDSETGMTLMRMVRRLDAGPMVDKEAFPVERLETGATAEEKLAAACVPLLERSIGNLISRDVSLEEQEEERASHCRKLEKADGALDFAAPARALAHRINALHPWPGCFFEVEGQRIRIGLADYAEEEMEVKVEPGTVLAAEKEGLSLATGDGVLKILRLQRPGGRLLDAGDFLRGFSLMPGSVVSSVPMSSLV